MDKRPIITGIVTEVYQDTEGQAKAEVKFGIANTYGGVYATGYIDIYGEPVQMGPRFGIRYGDKLDVIYTGDTVTLAINY